MANRPSSKNVSAKPFRCAGCEGKFRRNSNRQTRCEPCRRAAKAAKEKRRRASFTADELVQKKAYERAYREKHKERLLELDRKRYRRDVARDREAILARARERHATRRKAEIGRKFAKGWRPRLAMTPEEKMVRQRERAKRRYHRDPLRWRMASAIRRVLKKSKARTSWCDLVGYSVDELRAHIEKQFTVGMDWAAFERGEIHIDHIVPLSAFEYQDAHDPAFQQAWSLANLRPLWWRDNLSKSNKRTHLI